MAIYNLLELNSHVTDEIELESHVTQEIELYSPCILLVRDGEVIYDAGVYDEGVYG
jgi:hypothetical protein